MITTSDIGVGAVMLAVYPWDITISTTVPNDSAMNVIAGVITAITELGNSARVTIGPLTRRDHRRLAAEARVAARSARVRQLQGHGHPHRRLGSCGVADPDRADQAAADEQPGDGSHRHVEAVHGEVVAAACGQDPEDRDREEARDASDGVVHARRDPGVAGAARRRAPSSSAGATVRDSPSAKTSSAGRMSAQ